MLSFGLQERTESKELFFLGSSNPLMLSCSENLGSFHQGLELAMGNQEEDSSQVRVRVNRRLLSPP